MASPLALSLVSFDLCLAIASKAHTHTVWVGAQEHPYLQARPGFSQRGAAAVPPAPQRSMTGVAEPGRAVVASVSRARFSASPL